MGRAAVLAVDTVRCIHGGTIRTERLELRPLEPAVLRAVIAGERNLASSLLGAVVPADWPADPGVFELRLAQLEREPSLQQWLVRAVVERSTETVVGHIGFHGPPGMDYLDEWLPGGIEFGFEVVPDRRRQGYAREAARGLMAWARSQHAVDRFVLTIAPDNPASLALAVDLGFRRIGSWEDPDDGTEIVFALRGAEQR